MANLNAPNGLVPVRHLKGGTIRYDGEYTIASGYASNLFLGDPVILLGTGTTIGIAVGGPMSPSAAILGIFAGCQYTDANGDVRWEKQWRASTATIAGEPAEAFVYTDPNVIYSVQYAGTLAASEIGQLFDFDEASKANGNTNTGISGVELEAATGGTQFKLHRLATAPEGIFPADISSANPRVEVSIVGTQLNVAS